MPRSNLDFSWLASLLTKSPTAKPNTNPNDPSEFERPSQWQRLIHPEASAQIDALNNRYVAGPKFAEQEHTIRNTIGGKDFDTVRQYQPESLRTVSPEAGYLLTGGDLQPTHTGNEGRALLNNQSNLPALQSNSDITNARLNLENSSAALKRAPVVNAGVDQGAVNMLNSSVNLEPLKISNDINQERNITPIQQESERNKADLDEILTGERLALAPSMQEQMRNESTVNLANSRRLPAYPIMSSRVGPSGNIMAPSRDPLATSPFAEKMAGISDLQNMTNNGVETITLPSGQKIGIKKSVTPTEYDPSTEAPIGRQTIAKPVLSPTPAVAPVTSSPVPSPKIDDVLPAIKDLMFHTGVLDSADLLDKSYTGRGSKSISKEAEISIIKSKLAELKKVLATQKNPSRYDSLIGSFPQ